MGKHHTSTFDILLTIGHTLRLMEIHDFPRGVILWAAEIIDRGPAP